MPLSESTRLDLEAIDAALAGEPVDPQYADLAELALLLADVRPELSPGGAATLERRLAALRPAPRPRGEARRPWFLRPALGAGLALAAIIAVLVVVLPQGGGGSSNGPLQPDSAHVSSSAAATSAASAPAHSASGASAAGSSASAGSTAGSGSKAASGSSASSGASIPTPRSNGRRVVQSSQLSLTAPARRIGTVAQELFDVVGTERGIVKHSQVSSGSGAYASFTLSIPTANLAATLSRLAQLHDAQVASSSASSSDVNSQYLDDRRRLADAKTLRQSLLTQLQAASTATAIDSLKQQISHAEAAIARDEAAINRLQGQISFSAVSVTISAANSAAPAPAQARSGFTLRRAVHDALDVLKVSAGAALIVLAVLIPLAGLVALLAAVRSGWRRHERERALDTD